MTTKAGKAQLSDVRQGKTFWQVSSKFTIAEGLQTSIEQVFCNARPETDKKSKYKYSSLSGSDDDQYLLVNLSIKGFHRTGKTYRGCYAMNYNFGPVDLRYDVNRATCNNWLFMTRRQAEKFERDLHSTFKPTDTYMQGVEDGEYHDRRHNEWFSSWWNKNS